MKNKGITLVSLIVTVIILAIIGTATVYSGINTITSARLKKFHVEMEIIRLKCNELLEDGTTYEDLIMFGQEVEVLPSEKLSQINNVLQQVTGSTNTEGYIFFDKIGLNNLGITSINREVIINFYDKVIIDINGVKDANDEYIYSIDWTNNAVLASKIPVQNIILDNTSYTLKVGSTFTLIPIITPNNASNKKVTWSSNNQSVASVATNGVVTANSVGTATITATTLDGGKMITCTVTCTNSEVVNRPQILTGMIPVYYDNGWKKADGTKDNWYSYSTEERKWANVVTVKENGVKTRQTYMNAAEGTAIVEDDILAMFVWIPRYAYKITSGYHTAANGTGEIQIKFLNEATDNYNGGTAVRQANTNAVTNGNRYVVHPAFTAGNIGSEIKGMWVGKFESSNYTSPKDNEGITASSSSNLLYGIGDNQNVTIKPNVTSWRYTDVLKMYEVCQAMNDTGNIHGLTSQTDTMMMKNSQWGAVAYLAQSNYGNKQIASDNTSGIWNNSYYEGHSSMTLTGIVGATKNDSTSNTSPVSGKVINSDGTSISLTSGNTPKTFYRYNTEIGQKGSTTRNIYGIYDMSGGSWEYMASFLTNGTQSYVGTINNHPEIYAAKYVEKYAGNGVSSSTADRTANYEANSGRYGDAVYETSNGANGQYSWNEDYSHFPYLTIPFFIRGGVFYDSSKAGVFYFVSGWGGSQSEFGFRVVAF